MSRILAASRPLISAATTAHIIALRQAVKQSERAVAAEATRTDVAKVTAAEAARLADTAAQAHVTQRARELAADKAHANFVKAANIEARTLRRGVTI